MFWLENPVRGGDGYSPTLTLPTHSDPPPPTPGTEHTPTPNPSNTTNTTSVGHTLTTHSLRPTTQTGHGHAHGHQGRRLSACHMSSTFILFCVCVCPNSAYTYSMGYDKQYYQAHKAVHLAIYKRWWQRHPEQVSTIMRALHYRRRLGCTVADYDAMFVLQDGKCAMCRQADNQPKQHFDIDHDHYTGEARGLLCNRCNTLVGQAEHLNLVNKNILKEVEKYLAGRVLLVNV